MTLTIHKAWIVINKCYLFQRGGEANAHPPEGNPGYRKHNAGIWRHWGEVLNLTQVQCNNKRQHAPCTQYDLAILGMQRATNTLSVTWFNHCFVCDNNAWIHFLSTNKYTLSSAECTCKVIHKQLISQVLVLMPSDCMLKHVHLRHVVLHVYTDACNITRAHTHTHC